MNKENEVQGDWNEIKDKIKSKWSKFTDAEIETFKGNLELLSSKIQKTYGHAPERADRECNEFKATLSHVREPMKPEEKAPVAPLVTPVLIKTA